MTDYAAPAPVQPIVQGLVSFPLGPGPGNPVAFEGKGISAIARGASAQGSFLLTLDVGLPGNAGAVPPVLGQFGPPLPQDPDVRTLIVPIGIGAPPLSGIVAIGVAYETSAVPGVGATQIQVVTTNGGFVPIDPKGGFEIVVWRGQGLQAQVP